MIADNRTVINIYHSNNIDLKELITNLKIQMYNEYNKIFAYQMLTKVLCDVTLTSGFRIIIIKTFLETFQEEHIFDSMMPENEISSKT